jgi:ATP-binding cassette subfamily B protein
MNMAEPAEIFRRFPGVSRLAAVRKQPKIPVIAQRAGGECGAAALAMVLGFHGRAVSLTEVRRITGAGRDGARATSLVRAGRFYGLRTRVVRLEMEDLASLPRATILHWEFNHYVILDRVRGDRVDIVDPAGGRRSVPMKRFREAFTGVALILEPGETFERGGSKPRKLSGLWDEILRQKGLFGRIISFSFVIQALTSALPLMTAILIDDVVPQKDHSLLAILALGYGAFQVVLTFTTFVRAQLIINLRTRLEVCFTLRFLDHLVDLPYSFFQQHTAGDLMVRMGSNNTVRDLLTSTVLSALVDATSISIYLVLMLVISRTLAFTVIAVALTRIVLVSIMRWRQRILLAESLENQAQSQTGQVEMLSAMETLKAMGMEHRAAEDWSNVFVDGLNISIRRGRLDAAFAAVLSVLSTLNTLALMFYGTYMALNGRMTVGSMMAFNAMAASFMAPLDNLATGVSQLQMLEVYLERLNDVMDMQPEQDKSKVEICGPLTGTILVEDVSFRYSTEGPPVVDKVSVTIRQGSRIALVGRSGSGKSTLARIIAGLYEPESGRVLYDGRDLKSLDRPSVRAQLGIATQDIQLFGGSIRRNIALVDPHMGMDHVVYAARMACIHQEIMAMPMGYETALADRGLSLSGGQRLGWAIARAIAANPKILVLDESTSHLDLITEQNVNENIAKLGCTRIVVAHRLSTIIGAERILMMQNGRVVEQGTHEELLRMGGAYASLFSAQNRDSQTTGFSAVSA